MAKKSDHWRKLATYGQLVRACNYITTLAASPDLLPDEAQMLHNARLELEAVTRQVEARLRQKGN